MGLRSVGPGWATLINQVFDAQPQWVRVIQIKEKMGLLIIYAAGDSNCNPDELKTFLDLIRNIQIASRELCEGCGAVGYYRSGAPGRWWIRTLCNTCEENYQSTGDQPWL